MTFLSLADPTAPPSHDYRKKLHAHGLRPSMSGPGNCYDNSTVETFQTPEGGNDLATMNGDSA